VAGLATVRLPRRKLAWSRRLKTLLKEAFGYAAASGCALLIDISVLWGLVHFLAIGYLTAATISFLAGAVVAYQLSVRIAFKRHRLLSRDLEFLCFVAIGGIGLAVNVLVIFFAVTYLGLHYLAAKCVAAGFTFSCNFIARRQILFSVRRPNYRQT
jgi:putative flippase GtrA